MAHLKTRYDCFVRKKREYKNFLIENGLDLNFETQVFIELQTIIKIE